MRALVIEGGALSLRDVPVPSIAGECLIRVRMAGICGTDLQLLEGYAEFRGIPGHEFVGTVESVSSPEDEHWIGRRVAGEINVGCGRCEWCRRDEKEHCPGRSVLGIRGRSGAFAEFLSLPAANLHAIPDSLDDETAVFVEPTAAACRIVEQIALDRGTRAAVLGDGRLALLIAQVLKMHSPHVTLLGRHDEKIAVARSLGVDARHAGSDDAGAFDIVVEATGRAAGLPEAMRLARPRGTVVMKSTFHGAAPLETWPVVVNEVTLVGSRCGPFDAAIAALEHGHVRVKPLVARVTTIEDHAAAFAGARLGHKILLQIG